MESGGDLWCVTPLSQAGKGTVKGTVKGRTSVLSWLARTKVKQLVEETRTTTELKLYRAELKGEMLFSSDFTPWAVKHG